MGKNYFAVEVDEFWLKDALVIIKSVSMTPGCVTGDGAVDDV